MQLTSKSKFAKSLGLSATYINDIKDQLSMVQVEGKKIPQVDLHGSATLEFIKKRELSQLDAPPTITPKPDTPPKTKPVQPGNNPTGLPLTGESKKLQDIKIQEQIEQLRIKNQQSRGDLIEKLLIKKLFGKMYEIDQNEFKTINVSITPKISAVYNAANTTKTKDIIELITAETDIKTSKIKNLKSEINKTLEAGEPDRILEMNKILEDATGKILENIQREIDGFINMIEEKGE